MIRHTAAIAVTLFLIALEPLSAAAQPVQLTLDDALERARTMAPSIVAARIRLDEARERLTAASRLFEENPEVELRRARRDSEGGSSWDQEVELHHPLELRGERRARVRTAEAAILEQQALLDDLILELQTDVARAHADAIAASRSNELSQTSLELADKMAEMMMRRYEAGDVAQLDVNLARSQQARARAAALATAAHHHNALATLASLLGYLPTELSVSGSLETGARHGLAALRTRLESIPEVRVIDARIAEAEGELQLGRAMRWPEVGIGASWAEEEGDEIIGATIGFTLPVYDRGQLRSGVARARLVRLKAERAAIIQSYEATLMGLIQKQQALAAAAEHAEIAAGLAVENEQLALESYEGGQIGLAELILVRRESADARAEWIDRLLDARRAAIETDRIGGFQ